MELWSVAWASFYRLSKLLSRLCRISKWMDEVEAIVESETFIFQELLTLASLIWSVIISGDCDLSGFIVSVLLLQQCTHVDVKM
jgi:hypothetical protein